MSHQLALDLEDPSVCQRWTNGRHSFVRTSDGGFDPDQYTVREADYGKAKQFVTAHHYSHSWPATRFALGLYRRASSEQPEQLVGVLVLGVPMHKAVLTNTFPRLTPYTSSLEISRLVLREEVEANAESWFSAKSMRLAYERGIRGVIAHSDPEPRARQTPFGPEPLHPGHVGTLYQALGMEYLNRTRARRLTVLPDGTVLNDRAKAKIYSGDRGHQGSEDRLVRFGARPREEGEDGRNWLDEALDTIGATYLDHGGNHRYALYLSSLTRRRVPRHVVSYPYPKKHAPATGTPA